MSSAFDPHRWTRKTAEALQAAMAAARDAAHPEVTPEHLLLALLGQTDGVALPLLDKAGLQALPVRDRLAGTLDRLPHAYGSEPQTSAALRDGLQAADREREQLGDGYLSAEHLLLALADRLGVSREQLLVGLQQVRGSHRVTSQDPEQQYQALEEYGRDLTEDVDRIDEIVRFRALTEDDIVEVLDIQGRALEDRMAERRLALDVSDDARRWLAHRGYDPAYGARPLERLLQHAVVDPLALEVPSGVYRDGDTVHVDVAGDELVLK